MRKKLVSFFLACGMVFGLSFNAQAEIPEPIPGVDVPGIAGIFIDPIEDKLVNPVELADLQANGLVIPVKGYVGYLTELNTQGNSKNPKLDILDIKGEIQVDGSWQTSDIFYRKQAIASVELANGKPGASFDESWTIKNTGIYRIKIYATFTGGYDPLTGYEEYVVELVSPEFTVYPMAAPNIAEIILENEGVDPNQSTGKGKNRVQLNLISEVAKKMENGAVFNGVAKSIIENEVEVMNPDYWTEVLSYLNNIYAGADLTYSYDDYVADLIGPV